MMDKYTIDRQQQESIDLIGRLFEVVSQKNIGRTIIKQAQELARLELEKGSKLS